MNIDHVVDVGAVDDDQQQQHQPHQQAQQLQLWLITSD
jgi:hypothetical protein